MQTGHRWTDGHFSVLGRAIGMYTYLYGGCVIDWPISKGPSSFGVSTIPSYKLTDSSFWFDIISSLVVCFCCFFVGGGCTYTQKLLSRS